MSQRRGVVYGDARLECELPDHARILTAPPPVPALKDPKAAAQVALAEPLGLPPLRELVKPGDRVTIAFDDPTMPTPDMAPPDARELIIPLVVDELMHAGVRREDLTLLCAVGIHRKWTRSELASILGGRLVEEFWPAQLINHDAEDRQNLVYLGRTELGQEVEINRLLVESDLTVYVNVNWTPYNGGWKSVAVGLGSFRSIRHHHNTWTYDDIISYMQPGRSRFHRSVNAMGILVDNYLREKRQPVFQIETALNNEVPPRIAGIYAGYTPLVHERTLDISARQFNVVVEGQADIVVVGVPNLMPYTKFSRINPILAVRHGIGYLWNLYWNRPLVHEGGVFIMAHPCTEQFDDIHHPSYREFYASALGRTKDPAELYELFADDYANRPEYVHKYRYAHGFHGAHPVQTWATTAYARKYLGKIIIAGAEDSRVVRHLGFDAAPSVEAALTEATAWLGGSASVTYMEMPPIFIAEMV